MQEVSRRVWGLRLRRTVQGLALSPLAILPSAPGHAVGVPIGNFRNSIPIPPIPLSMLRWVPCGNSARLGAEWIAGPFSWSSFISYFLPVYPGARPEFLLPLQFRAPRFRVLGLKGSDYSRPSEGARLEKINKNTFVSCCGTAWISWLLFADSFRCALGSIAPFVCGPQAPLR